MTQCRIVERGAVERDLVGAGVERRLGVLLGPDAAADGERNEELGRDAADGLGERAAVLDRRGDVEDHQLVDPFDVVASRQRRRIAGRREILELHALDDAAVADVEAGDDPFG